MFRRVLAAFRRRGGSDTPDQPPDGSDAGDRPDEADPGDPRGGVGAEDDGDRSFWDLIPRWRYSHYVQSGGGVRDEQERAIEEIQEQAEAIEAEEDHGAHLEDE